MAAKTDGERIDRLEQVVHILAEDQVKLQDQIAEIHRALDATSRTLDRVIAHAAEQQAEMDRRFAETDRRMQETDRQMKETDARIDELRAAGRDTDLRIDKLVLAIGAFIQRLPPTSA